MSEHSPEALLSTSPNKRRRWALALLLSLMVCGGAYWQQNRFTEKERFLVGRWAQFEPNVSMQFPTKTWELGSDRSMYLVAQGSSIPVGPNSRLPQVPPSALLNYQWMYRSDIIQLTKQDSWDRTIHDWINSGLKKWRGESFQGQLRIFDQDTIEITLLNQQTKNPANTVIWKRVTPK